VALRQALGGIRPARARGEPVRTPPLLAAIPDPGRLRCIHLRLPLAGPQAPTVVGRKRGGLFLALKVLISRRFSWHYCCRGFFAYDADRALFCAAYRQHRRRRTRRAFLDGGQSALVLQGQAGHKAFCSAAKEFGGRGLCRLQARQKLALRVLAVVLLVAQQEIGLLIPPSIVNTGRWS